MTRKQIIIISSIIFVLIIGIVIVSLSFPSTKKLTGTPQGTVTTDPVSGEKVIQDSNLIQSGNLSNVPDNPTILGLNKLIDYGLSSDQQINVAGALNSFSVAQKPKITQISLYQDSYTQKIDGDTGTTTFTFKIQANKATNYFVVVSYIGSSAATTKIYATDQTTLLFTQ